MTPIIVGKFGQSFGIQGWIKIRSYTEPAENIFNYLPWQVNHSGQWETLDLEDTKHQGVNWIVKIRDCSNPEQAHNYLNCSIFVNRSQFTELSADEYYWIDLIGLEVINQQGIRLGIVDHLFATGANDVLVIKGNKRHLLPYTKEVILAIDFKQKTIFVNWDNDF